MENGLQYPLRCDTVLIAHYVSDLLKIVGEQLLGMGYKCILICTKQNSLLLLVFQIDLEMFKFCKFNYFGTYLC